MIIIALGIWEITYTVTIVFHPPPTHTYNVATDGPVGPIETKINLKEKIAKFCFEKNLVI